MKQLTIQQLTAVALLELEQSGATHSNITRYRYSGFAAFVRYCEKNNVGACTDEMLEAVIELAHLKYECGGIHHGTLALIRRSGKVLKNLRDTPAVKDLRTWIPKPLHYPPSKAELCNPDNIFGLVWRMKQEMQNFGFTQRTMAGYQGQGFYPILMEYHSAGRTEYSKEFTVEFIARTRQLYEKGMISQTKYQAIRKIAWLLIEYHSTGKLEWKQLSPYPYGSRLLSPEHTGLMADFKCFLLKAGGLKGSTQQHIQKVCKKFLCDLQDVGVDDVTGLTVRAANEQLTRIAEGYNEGLRTMLYYYRVFFQFLYDIGKTSTNLCVAIPDHVPRRKQIRDGFSEDEIERLLSTPDISTAVGKRNFAIILLAVETGLRACDIANLKRTDIDWRSYEIRIVQEKTGVALTLPLPIESGNAIAEYILKARPKADIPNVFLCCSTPFRALPSKSLRSMLSKVMKSAEIIDIPNKRRGFHSLRRYFARQLLESGVTLDMLGEMLGQTNMNSVKPYAATFEKDLKQCALNLVSLGGR